MRPIVRRMGRVLLAAWYLLVSTGAPAFALDQLLPQTKTIASADFPCAHHDCDCRTAERCRLRCCCHPQSPGAAHLEPQVLDTTPIPHTVRVNYLSVRACAGSHAHPGGLTAHELDRHLSPAVREAGAFAPERLPARRNTDRPPSILRDVPDQVPR